MAREGKAVEDSQDAREEVLLPAYRVTGNPEVELQPCEKGVLLTHRICSVPAKADQ